ncbi:hypothetical protein CR205_12575 [Alteribacter lacisalsi]|uniref:Uncharacterized protein n=1 Tax=Alteribacter lacisalsi TaxID=2045244 RepID=A0A2W0H3Y1_9BACI|nr:hypothetical protein [Alteribacter lacisalsi]PYZ96543.1 hypothetical protein CR205_12575 [Alteribacter lacisalsi]
MISAIELLKKTAPFIFLRIGIYMAFAAGSLVYVALMSFVGLRMFTSMGDGSYVTIFILMLAALFGGYGIMRWLERYVIYLVKAGHIYVMTELITKGTIPEGKSQIGYGKDKVVETFGRTSVFFVVNRLVDGSVRQIQRWFMKTADFLSFIPQAKALFGIVSRILGTAVKYVDEAVLSYTIMKENNQKSVWRNAADGVVYYGQSWKGVMKTAVLIVIINAVMWWGTFFLTALAISALITFQGNLAVLNILPVIFAFFFATAVRKAFADPVATAMMIRAYHAEIQDQELQMDLGKKMHGASSKFRELVSRDKKEKQKTEKMSVGTT